MGAGWGITTSVGMCRATGSYVWGLLIYTLLIIKNIFYKNIEAESYKILRIF